MHELIMQRDSYGELLIIISYKFCEKLAYKYQKELLGTKMAKCYEM